MCDINCRNELAEGRIESFKTAENEKRSDKKVGKAKNNAFTEETRKTTAVWICVKNVPGKDTIYGDTYQSSRNQKQRMTDDECWTDTVKNDIEQKV